MTRLKAERVDVLQRDGVPVQFLWHGRLHVVREVLDHWRATGAWWRQSAVLALASGDTSRSGTGGLLEVDDQERRTWRVEAAAGSAAPVGVYELTATVSDGSWWLVRVHD